MIMVLSLTFVNAGLKMLHEHWRNW